MLTIWFKTIFSFRVYHHLRQAGPWRTAFFALYLLLVGVLAFNLYFAWQVHEKLPVFIRNFPTVAFEKGRLISDQSITLRIPGTTQQIVLSATDDPIPSQQDFINKQIVAFIHADRIYMPSVRGVSSQALPTQLDGHLDPQTLQQYAPMLRNLLQSVAFLGSFLIVGGFLVFAYFMAWTVCFFWCGLKRTPLPARVLSRWAVFLQGPAMLLWIINLFYGIPLFVFAIFILFNMYVQQIFNTMPDQRGKYVA